MLRIDPSVQKMLHVTGTLVAGKKDRPHGTIWPSSPVPQCHQETLISLDLSSLIVAVEVLHVRIGLGIFLLVLGLLLLDTLGGLLLWLSFLVRLVGISGGVVVGVHVLLGSLLAGSGSSLLLLGLGGLSGSGVAIARGAGEGFLDLGLDHAPHAGSRLRLSDFGQVGQLAGVDLYLSSWSATEGHV